MRARDAGCGARAVPADGGVPVRQPGGRRVGRQGERLAARRGADRLRRRLLRRELDENLLYRLDVVANEELRIGLAVVDKTIGKELLAASCTRRWTSRRTSPRATTRSSSCSGARTSTARVQGPATAWTDLAQGTRAPTAIATVGAAYLAAATDLLVDDLREIGAAWQPGGAGRAALETRTATRVWPRSSPASAACPTASWPASG